MTDRWRTGRWRKEGKVGQGHARVEVLWWRDVREGEAAAAVFVCVRHAHAKVAHTRRPQTTRERERRGEVDGRARNDVHFVKAPGEG